MEEIQQFNNPNHLTMWPTKCYCHTDRCPHILPTAKPTASVTDGEHSANLGYYVLVRCHIKHCTLSVHPSHAFQLLILLIRVRHSSYSMHIFLSNLCSEFSQ